MFDTSHESVAGALPEFAAGNLDSEQASRVTAHLNECSECAEWNESYSLIEQLTIGSPRSSRVDGHPSTETLADYIVAAEDMDTEIREEIAEHVKCCRDCSDQVQMGRAALSGARSPVFEDRSESPPLWQGVPAPRWAPLAWAAALTAAVLLAGLYFMPSGPAVPEKYLISQLDLTGSQTIEAVEEIAATASQVASGARITLQADNVVLGNGFSVAENGSLVVAGAH